MKILLCITFPSKGQLYQASNSTSVISGSVQSPQQEGGLIYGQLSISLHQKVLWVNNLLGTCIFPIKQKQLLIIRVGWGGKEAEGIRPIKVADNEKLNCGWLWILFLYFHWNMGVSGILRICISDKVIKIDHRNLSQKTGEVILALYLLSFWSPIPLCTFPVVTWFN